MDIEKATFTSRVPVFSPKKGLTARAAYMVEALTQHGYELTIDQVKAGVCGVTPGRAVLDDLKEYKTLGPECEVALKEGWL